MFLLAERDWKVLKMKIFFIKKLDLVQRDTDNNDLKFLCLWGYCGLQTRYLHNNHLKQGTASFLEIYPHLSNDTVDRTTCY